MAALNGGVELHHPRATLTEHAESPPPSAPYRPPLTRLERTRGHFWPRSGRTSGRSKAVLPRTGTPAVPPGAAEGRTPVREGHPRRRRVLGRPFSSPAAARPRLRGD